MRIVDGIAILASLCILAGASLESASIAAPANASAYHARVRAIASKIGYTAGEWIGRDVEVPSDAVGLLRPNVVINREFTNTITGDRVSVLFVQCGDARDMTPHYPPRCYVLSRGMERTGTRTRDWTVGGLAVPGTEYEFRSGYFGVGESVVVQNFILLPDGRICRDMEPVRNQVASRERYYGAGQMQLAFDAGMSAESRDAAFVEVVSDFRPLIDAILAGKKVAK